ncbi:hypothetical protein GQ53DRAFT_779358 [Thozetella sp. PMI_491]|nr:hypothetical protein GQ53DRAFT_779358 [Thozetella sp. PMI_491]
MELATPPSTYPLRSSEGTPSPSIREDVRKRGLGSDDTPEERRKIYRVTRACDACKTRKARCSGTDPCQTCVGRGLQCRYLAKYGRGKPPTPAPAPAKQASSPVAVSIPTAVLQQDSDVIHEAPVHDGLVSRASSEACITEIQGQYYNPTSGLAFLHRAWKRLTRQHLGDVQHYIDESNSTAVIQQPQVAAGDKPFEIFHPDNEQLPVPDHATSQELLAFYFDECMGTYRFLHRQTTQQWLDRVMLNIQQRLPIQYIVGETRASIVLATLAIAIFHRAQSKRAVSTEEETYLTRQSDQLFSYALRLTDLATGFPNLESVQEKLIHALYLLHTSRMNQAWYLFGNALQFAAALGLHRCEGRKRNIKSSLVQDYIKSQFQKRTFWVMYIIDQHLGIIFGRPQHYHDQDVDQEYPDCVEDEDMTPEGPRKTLKQRDSAVAALIHYAKLSRILGKISREIYTLEVLPRDALADSIHRVADELSEWKANLPPLLGVISPYSLAPPFRRQAKNIRMAYSHAVMHATRPFLLRSIGAPNRNREDTKAKEQIKKCINAARNVLETVDNMASEGTMFHAFWWTHYMTFCALAIVYIWELQQDRRITPASPGQEESCELFELAEKCQAHLAEATAMNSPSRRYSIVLQELREEAKQRTAGAALHSLSHGNPHSGVPTAQGTTVVGEDGVLMLEGEQLGHMFNPSDLVSSLELWDNWQTTDWLDIDSFAFSQFSTPLSPTDPWLNGTVLV